MRGSTNAYRRGVPPSSTNLRNSPAPPASHSNLRTAAAQERLGGVGQAPGEGGAAHLLLPGFIFHGALLALAQRVVALLRRALQLPPPA